MMTKLCFDIIRQLQGKTLVTAESLTGGGIGHALTSVSGSSAVYKGGIISYTNEVKNKVLGVPEPVLEQFGAVSEPVAKAMAEGAKRLLNADIAVSVTGLAGPGADEYGNPVGTVFIGYADDTRTVVQHHVFAGDREAVRDQTIVSALNLILEQQ